MQVRERENNYISSSHLGLIRWLTPCGVSNCIYAQTFCDELGYSMQVRTVDGRMVWRRRHYRVRRAKQPGTFNFSVLDNGVISKEYWRCCTVDTGKSRSNTASLTLIRCKDL